MNARTTELLQAEIASLQAKIDALMLEYCPAEMDKSQLDNWGAHQVAVEIDLDPVSTHDSSGSREYNY